jgi:hypothetical protein
MGANCTSYDLGDAKFETKGKFKFIKAINY